MEPIGTSLGLQMELQNDLGIQMEPESSQVRKQSMSGTLASPFTPSFFDDFSDYVPKLCDFLGMLFAGAISLRFSMDSWTSGRLEIMQNHWRVAQNQGFANSEKERFQVTI